MMRLALFAVLGLSACSTGAGGSGSGGSGGAGNTGSSGAAGSVFGATGATGSATGSATGNTGATGATGTTGTTGGAGSTVTTGGAGATGGAGTTGGAGATGTTGAMGAVGDADGMGDAGASGTSGVTGPFPIECDPDAGAAPPINPTIEMIVQGTNGTLASLCDPQGNLSEPVCETQSSCGGGPNPGCTQSLTGNVVTQTIDCAGHCVNGACDGRCPVAGDPFHCVSTDEDGGVVIVDDANERNFACTIVFSAPSYDCVHGIQANAQGTLQAMSVSKAIMSGGAVYCTGQSFGNVDVTVTGVTLPAPYDKENCTLACSVAP